jgi:hypothetical protein
MGLSNFTRTFGAMKGLLYYIKRKSLKKITIPKSATYIGGGVFWMCESLTEITIPNSVTSIEEEAFSHCK